MRSTAALLLLAAGCAPLAPPYQVFETAETLRKHEVSVTAAGGAGYYGDPHVGDPKQEAFWGGGAGARVRYGVADGQEIGGEAAVNISGNSDLRDMYGATTVSGKLAWKAALGRYLAFLAGFGFAEYIGKNLDGSGTTTTALGGDLAFVGSPARPLAGLFRPYGAVRGVLSGAVLTDDKSGSRAPNFNLSPGLLVAAGLSLEPSARLRLYAELGVGFLWDCDSDRCKAFDSHQNYGLYGGVGIAYVFGR